MPKRKSTFSPGSRDKNEPGITEIIRAYHVPYGLLPEGFGADILLFTSPMTLIEVKNPSYKWTLTDKEKERQAYCAENNIPYFVVQTQEEIAEIVHKWVNRPRSKK